MSIFLPHKQINLHLYSLTNKPLQPHAPLTVAGTLADKASYKQFVGSVHVMKAVALHMVLTFCARNTDGQRFSVLLGREHKLPKSDLRGINKLLERRNLQLLSVRESCAAGASAARPGLQLGFGLLIASTLLRKLYA